MVWRKKVKAATLLYALLMLSVFSLLLQFYLQTQLAIAHGNQNRKREATAYLMAHMTFANWEQEKEEQPKKENLPAVKELIFTRGNARYYEEKEKLLVTVQLDSGQSYRYLFPISGEK